jgi:plastocyanin
MNKNILIGSLILILLISGCVGNKTDTQPTPAPSTNPGQTTTSSTSFSVEIKSFAFNPETINISKDQTVTWTQFDPIPHTITSLNSSVLNSPSLSSGQTFSYTFNETGTFEYYCKFHSSMKGKVIVK